MKMISCHFSRFFLITALQLLLLSHAIAQAGNLNNNFLFRITTPGETSIYTYGPCGFGIAMFGPSAEQNLCAEIVWAYDDVPSIPGLAHDSFCCNTISGQDLAGKIALIRRGGNCGFGLKVYNAQQAGAVAVLIVNNHTAMPTGDCDVLDMTNDITPITIPSIFLSRIMGQPIIDALAAGETVNGCFVLPRTARPMAGYHNLTPVTQVDTLRHMGFEFFNRETTAIENLVIKADISGPNGYSQSITTPINSAIAPGADTFLFFEPYLPPAVIGRYDITYSNSFYTDTYDTLRRPFWITPYSFGADNAWLLPFDGESYDNEFIAGGGVYQTGTLCISGPNGGMANAATFGIDNINSVYTQDNALNIIVYDADIDNDGKINLETDWTDLSDAIVGLGLYTMTGNEQAGMLQAIAIEDYLSPGLPIPLKPRHPYYISLFYDGTFEGSGHNIAFTSTPWSDYLDFPTTPTYLGVFHRNDWRTRTVVARLEIGYVVEVPVTPSKLLLVDKYKLNPNPANTILGVAFDLANTNETVTVSLVTPQGRLIRRQTLHHFQNGNVRFDVADVPSGAYLMLVHTEEGHAVAKVMVCH